MKVDYNLISSKEINEIREWTVFQVFILIFPLWLYLGEGVRCLEHGKEKNSRGIKDEGSGKKSGFKDACVRSKAVEKEHPARTWKPEFWSHLLTLLITKILWPQLLHLQSEERLDQLMFKYFSLNVIPGNSHSFW